MIRIIVLLILSSLFLFGCEKVDFDTQKTIAPINTPKIKNVNEIFKVDNVLMLVNQYRQTIKAPELTKSVSLCELAQNRANFLIADNMKAFLDSKPEAHVGMPEQKVGYNFSGEALMGIDISPFDHSANLDEASLKSWQDSPSHNKVLTRKSIKVWVGKDIVEKSIDQGCVAKAIDGDKTLMVLITGYK